MEDLWEKKRKREASCAICGRYGTVRHHIRTRGARGKGKDTIDLCNECHTTIHQTGEIEIDDEIYSGDRLRRKLYELREESWNIF